MMHDEQEKSVDGDLTRVEVSSLGLDKASGTPVVILKEKDGERILPIWIGPAEASAIAMVLAGIEFSRPLTHDLLYAVVGEMGGEILRVQIHRVVENTYYASIVLQRVAEVVAVDSRPSDSVALALRASAPIFVSDELLNTMPIDIQPGSEDQESWASSGEDVIPKRDPGPTGGTADPAGLRDYLKSLDPEDFGRFKP